MLRVGLAAGLAVVIWAAGALAQVAPPAPQTIAVGDWQIAPVLETRVRGEAWRDLDRQDRGFLLERARLGLDVQRGVIEARVVLQDVRSWDLAAGADRPWGLGPLALTSAYELWVEARSSAVRPMFLRVGRQPITWGEGRLLGVADWAPAGRALDAVRGRLPLGEGVVEALAAALSDPYSGGVLSYGELFGARGELPVEPLLAFEVYALARLAQADPPVADLQGSVRGQTYTGALRAYGDTAEWSWGVEGAYQLGRALDVRGGEDRAAWAAAAHATHVFERVLLTPSVGVGASYASGDAGGSTFHAFDPILPDVHVWHGAMDVFAWSNEEEVSARVAVTPWDDGVASVEYRYARLARAAGAWTTAYLTTIGQAPGNTRADLGHEIDGVVSWSPWVALRLTAGYSVLFMGDGARAALAAEHASAPALAQLGYVQTTLSLP